MSQDEDLIPGHVCKKCGSRCCKGEFGKNDCINCAED